MSTDPSVIESVAISAEDLVAAVEATQQREGEEIVLRATPPYSGRMRARIHVRSGGRDDGTVHLSPAALVDDGCPAYPHPDETADELRADPDRQYSVDRHREYHERRLQDWREAVPNHVVDTISLPAIEHDVAVLLLGE